MHIGDFSVSIEYHTQHERFSPITTNKQEQITNQKEMPANYCFAHSHVESRFILQKSRQSKEVSAIKIQLPQCKDCARNHKTDWYITKFNRLIKETHQSTRLPINVYRELLWLQSPYPSTE